jgi:hypothetical protein
VPVEFIQRGLGLDAGKVTADPLPGRRRLRHRHHHLARHRGHHRGQARVQLAKHLAEHPAFSAAEVKPVPVRPGRPGQHGEQASRMLQQRHPARSRQLGKHGKPAACKRPRRLVLAAGRVRADVLDLLDCDDPGLGPDLPVTVHQPFGKLTDLSHRAKPEPRDDLLDELAFINRRPCGRRRRNGGHRASPTTEAGTALR